jgi:putative SOS response-associated peptidase YedK
MEEVVNHFGVDVAPSVTVPPETVEGRQGLIVIEKDGLRLLLWDRIVVDPRYRGLIPLTHFANPDGPKGEKTRAWFSMNRQPLTWAGFCKNTPDFGPVFAGMTMTANEQIRPFNDRMPVLLKPEEYDRWLHGSIQDVIAIQFRDPPPSEDFEILFTRDRWQSGTPPGKALPRRFSDAMF